MAANTNARTRLLCLVEILTMYSDEQNILSIDEICDWLRNYGYEVSKRNVLSDIKAINTTPIKVIGVSKPKKGFYIAKYFSQDAIGLILESVFSSEILTENDVEYIKKYLRRCTCVPTLELVLNTMTNLNPHPANRKELSEVLHNLRLAIRDKKKAVLSVSRAIPGDFFSDAKEIETITVNPIILAVANGTVYLVFTQINSPEKAEYIHISRIENAFISEEESAEFTNDIASATNYFDRSVPKINLSKKSWLLLRIKTEDIETVENRFNFPVQFRKDSEEGYCLAKVHTSIDYSLIGWLFTLRDRIEILSPDGLKNLFEEKSKNS